MGVTIPPEPPLWPPILDPGEYYCVTMENWSEGFLGECSGEMRGIQKCCQQGFVINQWFDGDYDCWFNAALCEYPLYYYQKCINIEGPYPTNAICEAYCN